MVTARVASESESGLEIGGPLTGLAVSVLVAQ